MISSYIKSKFNALFIHMQFYHAFLSSRHLQKEFVLRGLRHMIKKFHFSRLFCNTLDMQGYLLLWKQQAQCKWSTAVQQTLHFNRPCYPDLSSNSTKVVNFEGNKMRGNSLKKLYEHFSCLYQKAFNFSVFVDEASHVSPKKRKKVHLNLILALSLE